MRTSMEDVLAAHSKVGSGLSINSPDTCRCGAKTMPERGAEEVGIRRDRAFAAHVAEALALSGFGNLHDAWAEGHHAGWDDRDTDPEFTPNPYPPKVSES